MRLLKPLVALARGLLVGVNARGALFVQTAPASQLTRWGPPRHQLHPAAGRAVHWCDPHAALRRRRADLLGTLHRAGRAAACQPRLAQSGPRMVVVWRNAKRSSSMSFTSEPGRPRRLAWRRRAVLGAVGAAFLMSNRVLALSAQASVAIKTVVNFDAPMWTRLLRQGRRAVAYVFTNSYCATCPAAFAQLQAAIAAAGQPVELAAVMMDVQGERALAHCRHYPGLTRMYAFNGFEPAIRQAVDPTWQNVTPYLVLIGRNGVIQRSIGPPAPAMLAAWLA
jgi:hypothetical protein